MSAARLSWATDVHLNFLGARDLDKFCASLAAEDAGQAVLTGDIAEAPSLAPLLLRVAEVARRPIYFVLGNHDFYGGAIGPVRAVAEDLARRSPWLRWLPACGVVELTASAALVGVDGWADARCGDFDRSPVTLNDHVLIADLAGKAKPALREKLRALGDAEAARLEGPLAEALRRFRRVIVATHVPPFREACWHEGKISNDDWLPHFTCRAVGDVLREAARAAPDREITVLCGHTHGGGIARIAPNLEVLTGAAEYGEPRMQRAIELERG